MTSLKRVLSLVLTVCFAAVSSQADDWGFAKDLSEGAAAIKERAEAFRSGRSQAVAPDEAAVHGSPVAVGSAAGLLSGEEDFGPIPGEALMPRQYPCPDPADVERCRLPGRREIRQELLIFDQQSPRLIRHIQAEARRLASAADQVRGLAGTDPSSAFRAFYLESAETIEKAAGDEHVAADLKLVGPDSPLRKKLQELDELVTRIDGRIDAGSDPEVVKALAIGRNIQVKALLESLRPLVIDMKLGPRQAYRENALFTKVKFDANRLIQFDRRCEGPEYHVFNHIFLSDSAKERFMGKGHPGLTLIEDAAVIRRALDGTPAHKGPLSFSCPKVGFSPSARYRAERHAFVNEFARDGGFIGDWIGGDFGITAGADQDKIAELLRRELKD